MQNPTIRAVCVALLGTGFFLSGQARAAVPGLKAREAMKRALDRYERGTVEARRQITASTQQPSAAPKAVVHSADQSKVHETEIGLEQYVYSYEETVEGRHFNDFEGRMIAVFLNHTFRLNSLNAMDYAIISAFRFEGQYAWGKLDYDGGLSSGEPLTIQDAPHRSYDLRGLVMKEYPWAGQADIYFGAGYRHLVSDTSDVSGKVYDEDVYGYRRVARYCYLPLGVTLRQQLASGWNAMFNAEYDILLEGKQSSYVNWYPGGEIINDQRDGFGWRCSAGIGRDTGNIGWLIEPFWRYWDIEDSDLDVYEAFLEPSNVTQELGVRLGAVF